VQSLAALRGDVEPPVVLALQPAKIDEPHEQGPAQEARDVGAVLDGIHVVPDGLAASRDRHAERLEKSAPGGRDRVPDLTRVRTRDLLDGCDVALLDQGVHQLDTEHTRDVVVTDSGLPPGPGLLALAK
jgi:hypothetical protein